MTDGQDVRYDVEIYPTGRWTVRKVTRVGDRIIDDKPVNQGLALNAQEAEVKARRAIGRDKARRSLAEFENSRIRRFTVR